MNYKKNFSLDTSDKKQKNVVRLKDLYYICDSIYSCITFIIHNVLTMNYEKKRLAIPLTAQLEITCHCNHRCIHCYNLDSKEENRPIQDVSDDTVIACAQKLIESGIFGVIITGGEPLIKKELTKEVISLFLKNGIDVNLNSNITLFDDDFIDFLKRVKVGVLTSCPSSNPVSYERMVGVDNYNTFEYNLKKLLQSGINVFVNMVVTKNNLKEIRSTANRIKQLGCQYFAATPMALNMDYPRQDLLLTIEEVRQVIADLLWVNKQLGLNVDILEALPKCVFPQNILQEKHSFLNRSCQAGKTVIAVSCNGDVRPCAHNSISYGNILKDSLRSIWANMGDWRSDLYIPQICKDCKWLNQCHCGCRTSAYGNSSVWDAKDVWCSEQLQVLPPNNNEQIEVTPETNLQLNKEYVYRMEYDDVFVVYNKRSDMYFMINKVLFDFISYLNKFDTISLTGLQKDINETEYSKSFDEVIGFLLQKKILKIVV